MQENKSENIPLENDEEQDTGSIGFTHHPNWIPISDRLLAKIQAGSGAVFGTFLSVHLVNHISANFGPHIYEILQKTFRIYYQNRWIEPVIIFASLGVHAVSNAIAIYRRMVKQKHKSKEKIEEEESIPTQQVPLLNPLDLHRYAGYFLSGIIFVHIAGTRGQGILFGTPIGFTAVSFTLINHPIVFYPYYALLACSGLYHFSFGTQQICRIFGLRVPPALAPSRKLFWILNGVGGILLLSSLLSFGGWYRTASTSLFPELIANEQKLFKFILGGLSWKALSTRNV